MQRFFYMRTSIAEQKRAVHVRERKERKERLARLHAKLEMLRAMQEEHEKRGNDVELAILAKRIRIAEQQILYIGSPENS
jgi:hypothetical protein